MLLLLGRWKGVQKLVIHYAKVKHSVYPYFIHRFIFLIHMDFSRKKT